jgi:hypothetical protein
MKHSYNNNNNTNNNNNNNNEAQQAVFVLTNNPATRMCCWRNNFMLLTTLFANTTVTHMKVKYDPRGVGEGTALFSGTKLDVTRKCLKQSKLEVNIRRTHI